MSKMEKELSELVSKDRVEKLIDETELRKTCSNLKEWNESIKDISAYKDADMISSFLKLFSNPIRLKIILILLEREWACNCEFEYAFNIHQALISHHLKLLRDGKIITYSKTGPWKYYKIRDEIRPYLKKLRTFLIDSTHYV
ncbi:MAG: helix-turn-helix transcriptional regulator [Asgard group archaeon]|nr:helix-turn-helix transcriptional regulator [Asgard group archaeon]